MNMISGINFLLKTQVKDRKVVVQKAKHPKGKWLAFPVDFWILVTQMVKNLSTKQETQIWSLGQEAPLEKGLATHSSIPAWQIPWTEMCGGL